MKWRKILTTTICFPVTSYMSVEMTDLSRFMVSLNSFFRHSAKVCFLPSRICKQDNVSKHYLSFSRWNSKSSANEVILDINSRKEGGWQSIICDMSFSRKTPYLYHKFINKICRILWRYRNGLFQNSLMQKLTPKLLDYLAFQYTDNREATSVCSSAWILSYHWTLRKTIPVKVIISF